MRRSIVVLAIFAASALQAAHAEDEAELAKKLANPISSLISVPFQFNYDKGFGVSDGGRFLDTFGITLNTESTYDWITHQWTVPVNLLFGRIFRIGHQPISLQAGPHYYVETPVNGPRWGARFNATSVVPRELRVPT